MVAKLIPIIVAEKTFYHYPGESPASLADKEENLLILI